MRVIGKSVTFGSNKYSCKKENFDKKFLLPRRMNFNPVKILEKALACGGNYRGYGIRVYHFLIG